MHRAPLQYVSLAIASFSLTLLFSTPCAAKDKEADPPLPVHCAELATNPENGLAGNPR